MDKNFTIVTGTIYDKNQILICIEIYVDRLLAGALCSSSLLDSAIHIHSQLINVVNHSFENNENVSTLEYLHMENLLTEIQSLLICYFLYSSYRNVPLGLQPFIIFCIN